MQDRAKYMPLIHQKYQTLKPYYPDLFKQIEEREKFYLDMIYTLMTKNKMVEQRIVKAMGQIKSLEIELSLWKKLGIEENGKEGKEQRKEECKEEIMRRHQSEDMFATLKNNNTVLESPNLKRVIMNTQTTIVSPNSQQKAQKQLPQPQKRSPIGSIDTKQRRLIYLQDRPVTTHEIVNLAHQPVVKPLSPRVQHFTKHKQFKQEIIKNLIHQPIYSNKRVSIQPEAKSESDKKSASQKSLNISKTEGKLSYEKYLTQKPPVQVSITSVQNIRRRY